MKIASAESISTHSKYLTLAPQLEKTGKNTEISVETQISN